MDRRRLVLLLPGVVGWAARAAAQDRPYIGTATMAPDGTISLWLRAELPGGTGHGHGTLVYLPSDPQYQAVLRHLGGLHPGENKPVRPWPDDPVPAHR
jgi:hypothetical protein